MKIISLVDDICHNEALKGEHGLCFYIETSSHKILFDLGASNLFAENAKKLDIDLQLVDIVIISHGHYDHGGGLKAFLAINSQAKIYINKKAFGLYYSLRNGNYEYAGLDNTLICEKRLVFTDSYCEIDKELTLIGVTASDMPSLNSNLMEKTEQGFVNDSFRHEQSLLIKADKTMLITGCSHCGIISIIEQGLKINGKALDYILGGFHLYNPNKNISESDEKIAILGKALQQYPTIYYTCHCTGEPPYMILKDMLKQNLHYLATGEQINIE